MSSPNEKVVDINQIALNKKISELKKKILLAEGQKKAYAEEWKEEQKLNSETIINLKKEIKELTKQLKELNIPGFKNSQKQNPEIVRKIQFPPGAKTAEEAVRIFDLKVIDLKKQIDFIHDKYLKRQKHFNKLVEQYHILMAYKSQNEDVNTNSSETVEEDDNRKLICHLENEIHRTTVQWMEAEHIRKKYRAIKGSLMNDSEKFESSLLELEQAISDQQAEIDKLQEINKEALQMRDATKMILQRQEQSANSSTRARERQAADFRRLVDERKLELERLERKIFSSGKTLVHQDSIGSGSGEPQTGKTDPDDPNAQNKEINVVDVSFRKVMVATGATATPEVLSRFLSQREATTRLTYLRTSTEAEKKHLEAQRDMLNQQLEAFRFADTKENEVNQEELEKIKNAINDQKIKMEANEQSAERTNNVIKTIRDSLVELFLKLQELEENSELTIKKTGEKYAEYNDLVLGNIKNDELLKMLEDKLRTTLVVSGQMANNEFDSGLSEDEIASTSDTSKIQTDELIVPIQTPSSATTYIVDDKERPPPYPICYANLISGRTTAQVTSTSPGQSTQIAASEDEGEVPSRSYLKRQAHLIVEAKSRRKGFRPAVPRRK